MNSKKPRSSKRPIWGPFAALALVLGACQEATEPEPDDYADIRATLTEVHWALAETGGPVSFNRYGITSVGGEKQSQNLLADDPDPDCKDDQSTDKDDDGAWECIVYHLLFVCDELQVEFSGKGKGKSGEDGVVHYHCKQS